MDPGGHILEKAKMRPADFERFQKTYLVAHLKDVATQNSRTERLKNAAVKNIAKPARRDLFR